MRDDDNPTVFEPPDADNPPSPKLIMGVRPVNAIEAALRCRAGNSPFPLPIIFYGDDKTTLERPADYAHLFADGTPLDAITPDAIREVMRVIDLAVQKPIRERFRLHIILARELGPRATEQQYIDACKRENLEPERNL